MEMHSGKKYVYSAEQANFYLQNGIKPLEIGRGSKGDVYIVFNYEEHKKMLPKWIEMMHGWSNQK